MTCKVLTSGVHETGTDSKFSTACLGQKSHAGATSNWPNWSARPKITYPLRSSTPAMQWINHNIHVFCFFFRSQYDYVWMDINETCSVARAVTGRFLGSLFIFKPWKQKRPRTIGPQEMNSSASDQMIISIDVHVTSINSDSPACPAKLSTNESQSPPLQSLLGRTLTMMSVTAGSVFRPKFGFESRVI